MSDMVERVARAMLQADCPTEDGTDCSDCWDAFGEDYLKAARVAIEAMRDPTSSMVETGHANIAPWWSPAMSKSDDYGNTRKAALSAWSGMIDAALDTKGE